MIINIFKKGTRELTKGTETYIVKWYRTKAIITVADIEPCFQAFSDKQEAEDFADSIRRAHELIGNTGSTDVTVTKQKSGL